MKNEGIKKETRILLIAHSEAESIAAKQEIENEIITLNKRFVHHIVHKNAYLRLNNDAVESAAYFGMMKAIRTFKLDTKATFPTYATTCITNEILMEARRAKRHYGQLSLDEPLKGKDSSTERTMIDLLVSSGDLQEDVAQTEIYSTLMEIASAVLPDREKTIFMNHIGALEEDYTQKELSKVFGISQSYVARLQVKAINTVRQLAEALNLKGDAIMKEKPVLTLDKYNELKAKKVTDSQIMYEYGMQANTFNAWKHSHDLIRKKDRTLNKTVESPKPFVENPEFVETTITSGNELEIARLKASYEQQIHHMEMRIANLQRDKEDLKGDIEEYKTTVDELINKNESQKRLYENKIRQMTDNENAVARNKVLEKRNKEHKAMNLTLMKWVISKEEEEL